MTTSLILHTILALLLLVLPFAALYMLDRPTIRPLAIAFVRGLVQLFVFALIAWGVFKANSSWVMAIWFLAMSIWTGWMVIGRCGLSLKTYLLPASAGLFGGALIVGLWLLAVALPIDAISPRWFVPVTAVLLGHSATMLVRGLSTYVSMKNTSQTQYDFLLGNGASQWQALIPFIRNSLLAVITPTISNLSALAIAALPLLFCGMLMGGFTPINAFAVMLYLVAGCMASSVLALGITLFLVKRLNRE